jgi:hypothetical protein
MMAVVLNECKVEVLGRNNRWSEDQIQRSRKLHLEVEVLPGKNDVREPLKKGGSTKRMDSSGSGRRGWYGVPSRGWKFESLHG